MTREQLKKHIELYQKTEQDVSEMDDKFGIRIWDNNNPNFYNNYNLLIHNLLVDIFGDENTSLIEDYCFKQINISFDDLCKNLSIE